MKLTEAIKVNTDSIAAAINAMSQSMNVQFNQQKEAANTTSEAIKLVLSNSMGDKSKSTDSGANKYLALIAQQVVKIASAVSGKSSKLGDKVGGAVDGVKNAAKSSAEQLAIIKDLGKSMFVYAKLGPLSKPIQWGVKAVKSAVIGIFEIFEDPRIKRADVKRVKSMSWALKSIGSSVRSFSMSLAATAVFAIPAIIGWFLIKGVITSAVFLFNRLADGKSIKNIAMGTAALNMISISLVAFAGSFLICSLIASKIGAGPGVEGALGALAIFGLALASYWLFAKVLGSPKNMTNVLLGAAALAVIGGSLILFSVALNKMTSVSIEDVGIAAAILGVGSLFVLLLGAIGMATGGAIYAFAIVGAATLAIMGGSLLLFALALDKITSLKFDENSVGTIGSFTTASMMLTGAFASMLPSALIALPAVGVMLLISLASIAVFKVMEYISKIKVDSDAFVNLGNALMNLKNAFLGEPTFKSDDNDPWWKKLGKGAANAVTGVVGGAVDLVRAIEAAAMYTTLATSAVVVAKALSKLSKLDTNAITAGTEGLNNALTAVSSIFDEGKNKSLFNTISNSLAGIVTFKTLSSGISDLANGIALFADIESRGVPEYDSNGRRTGKFTKVNFASISAGIIGIVKAMADAFNDPIFTETTEVSCGGLLGVMGAKKVVPKFAAALESFDSLGVLMNGLTSMVSTFSKGVDSKAIKTGFTNAMEAIKSAFADSSWMDGLEDKCEEWEDFHYITDALSVLNGVDLSKVNLGDILERSANAINNAKIENINAATELANKVSKLKDLKTDKLEKMFEKMIEASEKMIEMLDKSNALAENLESKEGDSSKSIITDAKNAIMGNDKKEEQKATDAAVMAPAPAPEPQEIRIYLNDVEGTVFRVSSEY